MTTRVVIHPEAADPPPLSLRQPLGVDLDLVVALRAQDDGILDPTPMHLQLALLPRSRGGLYGYDMQVVDAELGEAGVTVPGTAMNDPSGFTVELYSRRENEVPGDPLLPVALVAQGNIVMQGRAYRRMGPLGVISVPVVVGPPGPPGPQGVQGIEGQPGLDGAPGVRGSVWTTGPSTPIILGGEIDGDMYLNEANGDVWRFEAGAWAQL